MEPTRNDIYSLYESFKLLVEGQETPDILAAGCMLVGTVIGEFAESDEEREEALKVAAKQLACAAEVRTLLKAGKFAEAMRLAAVGNVGEQD